MNQEEIQETIRLHQKWLAGEPGGVRADFTVKHIKGADLAGEDLRYADFSGATIEDTVLRGTSFAHACLNSATLRRVDLTEAWLCYSDMDHAVIADSTCCKADFTHAALYNTAVDNSDLTRATFKYAGLHLASLTDVTVCGATFAFADLTLAEISGKGIPSAKFQYANLAKAVLPPEDSFRKGVILDKPMTGYKRTREGVVIKVEIPAGAIVFSINGSKCRANMARIVDTRNHEVLHSIIDETFTYTEGQEIVIKDFDLQYNVECASGFHFFRTFREAKKYR